jgi:uncharacterized membrane protein SirB2
MNCQQSAERFATFVKLAPEVRDSVLFNNTVSRYVTITITVPLHNYPFLQAYMVINDDIVEQQTV